MTIVRWIVAIQLLAACGAALCSEAPADPASPLNPDTPFGINGLGFFHRSQEKADLDKRLELLRELGAGWDRSDFWWSDIEPEPGKWDFAKADAAMHIYRNNGLQIFPILCYGARWKNSEAPATDKELAQWGGFVEKVVGRYRGYANYWEVWNEPNILPFWRPQPDPAAYARLLEVTARAARRANPDVKLVAFTCADADTAFMEKVLQAAGTDDFDALSYHFYRTGIPEERTADEVAEIRLLLQHYGKQCPIWVTENGVTSNFRAGVSEELQAVRWMRQNLLMLSAGVERVFPFTLVDNLSDPGGDAALELGMVRRNWQRKPVFTAYRTMVAELGECRPVGHVHLADGVHALLFEARNTTGSAPYKLAAWTPGDMVDVRVPGNCVKDADGKWHVVDGCAELVAMAGERRPIEYAGGVGRACVGPAPVYIPCAGGELVRNARMRFEHNPLMMSPGRPETTTLTVESGTPRVEWRMPADWTGKMDGSRFLFSAPRDAKPGWYTVRALVLEDTGTIAKDLRVWVRPSVRAEMRPVFTTATRDVPTSFTVQDLNLHAVTQWYFVAEPPVTGMELPAGVLMGHAEEGAARRVYGEEAGAMLPAAWLRELTSVTLFHMMAEPAEESRKGHVDRQRVFSVAPVPLGIGDPKIDGELSEYAGIDPMVLGLREQQLRGSPSGPEDASAMVRAVLTTSGLFLAADITDDMPMVNGYGAGGDVYKGDAVEVYIGPSGYTGQVYARPENGFFHFALSPGRGGENAVVSDFAGEVKGSRIAARARPGGYIMEAFIPREAFGGYGPATGEVIAWDVQLDDRDDYSESAQSKSFMWNGDDRNWLFAAKWGMAVVVSANAANATGTSETANETTSGRVGVIGDVVMPRRPVADAIADAIRFLRKADGAYVPGRIDGELAGYFRSAFVNEDGSRSSRGVSFPARQHAYFIFTFLQYGAYSGEKEWLARATDLADWNLAHSTPSNASYASLPYSVFTKGQPGGSRDKDAIEPDKSAFLGSAFIALYEATSNTKYLAGARAVADTLVLRQRQDGSWPFRVVPGDGTVRQDFGGAPVFYVQFFEDVLRHDGKESYRRAHARALRLMLERNVERNLWGTYHEDIVDKPEDYLSAEPMSFTAAYLFRHGKTHPEYVEMGRKIVRTMEERLVHTEGHPAAPAPAVSEQAGFEHMMPGHTARYCMALAELYKVAGDEQAKRKAISGINALTYMQSEAGLFRTFFQLLNEKKPGRKRPNWYSQHLYTVCHVLEAMRILPEIGNGSEAYKKVR